FCREGTPRPPGSEDGFGARWTLLDERRQNDDERQPLVDRGAYRERWRWREMPVALGVLVGFALATSLFAAATLLRGPHRVISPERQAMQAALHAAMATLPHLRKGLSPQSAATAAPHLRALTQAPAIALLAGSEVLAFDGDGSDHHHAGDALEVDEGRDGRVHVQPRFRCREPDCPLHAAIVAPLAVQGDRVGTLVVLNHS